MSPRPMTITITRTFKLVIVSTQVHEPERYMAYFEQIEPVPGQPFSVDPLLDFYSREDALRIGKLQFTLDIDQFFSIGDRLFLGPSEPLLIKGEPSAGVKSSTPTLNDR